MDNEVISNSSKIMRSAVFGQVIILIVYIPIFALSGIEGKMFLPMAQTVSFAIIGALLLSLTYVPLMSSLFLDKKIAHKESISDRFIKWSLKYYTPFLEKVLQHKVKVVAASVLVLMASFFLFNSLGGEFIPEMDEGDFATNYIIRQGSNLKQTIKTGTELEKIILNNFPEVKEVVSKIGTSEVPTDPMPVESADLIIVLKDKKDWTSAKDKDELAEQMNKKMSAIPGINLSFEQPIQMRFNELIAGVKSDIAIKIFGENLDILFDNGNEVSKIISNINGVTDVKVEQIVGMPQLVVKYNRARIAQYGLNILDLNTILNTALAGGKAGIVYEGERRFDLIVRLDNIRDADEEKVKNIYVPLPNGTQIPISQLAEVNFQSAPAQISRDDAERRIVVEANVRGRDIESVVKDIQTKLGVDLKLPSGYFITYGGTFQNLQEAKNRLFLAVPVSLFLIFLLLFFSFGSINESLIIFSAIPFAAIGGIVALWLRSMNFSISAGIGFIALFGVAVLNGIVLIAYFNRLRDDGEINITQRILKGTASRLRPVLATAAVASLGFLPMALSTSAGSEVQKPLATVVIGGLISSTLLTLIVLPVLYALFMQKKSRGNAFNVLIILLLLSFGAKAQSPNEPIQASDTATVYVASLDNAIAFALKNQPLLKSGEYAVQQQQQLKKTAFTFNQLNVNYQGGQINGPTYDYSVNVSTGINFPTEIASQSKYQNQQIALAQSQLNVTRATLIQNVSLAYLQVQYGMQFITLLDSVEVISQKFSDFANLKFKVGDIGILEKMTAENELKQASLFKEEAKANLKIYISNLKQWMGIYQDVVVTPISDFILPEPQLTDRSAMKSNPLFQLQEQQLQTAIATYKLQKSKYAPTLQFGYFNQSLDRQKGFDGFTLGTAIPIFKTGQQSLVKSAQLGISISQNDYYNFELNMNAAYSQALQQYKKYKQSLNYYQTEGLALNNMLLEVARKSYASGDIGYVEFITVIQNVYDNNSNYLQTLNNYNQSIVNLNFLINK
jgi:cobalt-zinc-cadmium resistance protein CzcA